MKFFPCFCLLFFIFSCGDDAYEKNNKPIDKNDTAVIKPQAKNPYSATDVSPLDISYFPTDYPIQKMTGKGNTQPVARVIYGRPHKQGRKVFGQLLQYGEAWRMGANEATELEFFQSVTVQNKVIPKGRYIMYGIINEDKWTIILNRNLFSWGLKPDTTKDVYKFDVPVSRSTQLIEYFTIIFEKTSDNSMNLLVSWDDVIVRLPIKF